MLLQDLLDRLATGELSQHKYGSTGEIREEDFPALLNQINLGLTNLHSYFPISEKEVMIQQFDHITEYRINSKYALSSDDVSINYKWVIDSEYYPFLDDIVRIERVYNEAGVELALNNESDPNSVFTTAWDTLQIPYPSIENAIAVIYRANHVLLTPDMEPKDTEVMIPPVLEEALQAFVASRCFVSLGNAASAGLATYYSQRYQQQVDHVERYNLLQSSSGDTNTKLTGKGFI